jgi:DnaJ domain
MSYHAFSLDPRTVLGVGSSASPDELREAYHAKSKKHHPDVGGDEWAFRLVARAYEVLKATTVSPHSSQAGGHRGPTGSARAEEQRWTWGGNPSFNRTDSSNFGRESARKMADDGMDPSSDENAEDEPDLTAHEVGECGAMPDELRRVNVELVWTRHERDAAAQFPSSEGADDATLSVCMVISWPPHSLLDRAAEFPSSGESMRTLIELFEHLRTRGSAVAAKSRIEDGQFVAWLSYPDVVAASDAFLLVRETLQSQGLIPKLKTRDIRLSSDHDAAVEEPVAAQAS